MCATGFADTRCGTRPPITRRRRILRHRSTFRWSSPPRPPLRLQSSRRHHPRACGPAGGTQFGITTHWKCQPSQENAAQTRSVIQATLFTRSPWRGLRDFSWYVACPAGRSAIAVHQAIGSPRPTGRVQPNMIDNVVVIAFQGGGCTGHYYHAVGDKSYIGLLVTAPECQGMRHNIGNGMPNQVTHCPAGNCIYCKGIAHDPHACNAVPMPLTLVPYHVTLHHRHVTWASGQLCISA